MKPIKEKILIIDDSPVDCMIMKKILLVADNNYEIILNNDGMMFVIKL